jgi:DHA1 family tetracycline resistance protein-like MFS transporter
VVQGGLIRQIVPKLGERRSLLIGLGIAAVSFLLYGLANVGWMMYVIPFLGALGGIAGPSAQAIISQNVQANEQGGVQGALTSLNALTGVIGPLMATNVFRFFISEGAPLLLPGAPFFLGTALIIAGLILAVNTFRRIPATLPTQETSVPPSMSH